MTSPAPNINVTPLIDILLVLLIIFMVIAPLKPTTLKAQIPGIQKPDNKLTPHPNALIVTIGADNFIALNEEQKIASLSNTEPLIARLTKEFRIRDENKIYDDDLRDRTDLSDDEKILKTVFVKAPRKFPYGDVTKVVDLIKSSGATKIGLQIDSLD